MTIEDYLERIGAGPPAPPSPAALVHLHERHMYTVPFETLDFNRGVPIELDLDHIVDKVIRLRRGGVCFELNPLFAWLLSNLGYRVSMLSGDLPRGDGSFNTSGDHMLLRVDFGPDQTPYLADVGYGDGFVRPLPFVPDAISDQGWWRYRVLAAPGDTWVVQRAGKGSDVFENRFRFTDVPRVLSDFERACTFHQTSPDSPYVRFLNCSRATPDGRVTLLRNRLLLTEHGQRTERWLRDQLAWKRALRRHFGIVLGPLPE